MNEKIFLNKLLSITPFICALMVIGIHSYNAGSFKQLGLTARIEGSLSHGLFTAAVPIFFFLSGYLFFRNAESEKIVFEKQKRRVKSLVIPFLSWSAFYYLFYAFATKINPGLNTVVDISVGGAIKGIIFYKHVFPMWFMFQLIIYTFLAPITFAVLKNRKITIVLFLIVAILGVAGIEFKIAVDSTERIIFAANYFSYYFLGCIAAKEKDNFLSTIARLSKMNTYLLCGILFAFSILEGLTFDVFTGFNNRIFIPVVAFFVFILLVKISEKLQDTAKPLISKVPTMVVYGLHPFIGTVISRVLQKLHFQGLVQYITSFVLCATITCCLALLLQKNKLLNILFNGDRM